MFQVIVRLATSPGGQSFIKASCAAAGFLGVLAAGEGIKRGYYKITGKQPPSSGIITPDYHRAVIIEMKDAHIELQREMFNSYIALTRLIEKIAPESTEDPAEAAKKWGLELGLKLSQMTKASVETIDDVTDMFCNKHKLNKDDFVACANNDELRDELLAAVPAIARKTVPA